MHPVDPSVALDMLAGLQSRAEAVRADIMARPRILRRFGVKSLRDLREPLNATVDYLSNSTDPVVINLLNKYPFIPSSRNIDIIVSNSRAIAERLNTSV